MDIGDLAPDFTLTNRDGAPFTLSSALRSGPVVLYFYPSALSRGCTKESCHFRDLASAFAAQGAQRIGVSMDDVSRQAKFAARNDLDYPLLSDPDGRVAALYGVKRNLDLFKVRRCTFVIDTDSRILGVFRSELSMEAHADHALALLAARTN